MEATMISTDTHLEIGSLLFEGLDQIDLTGPFEVLSRIPNSTYRIYGKTADPVRDLRGLRAAELLIGRRATTHWASFELLPYFGAIPVNERVVVDGEWVFAAGVTAGIDGALRPAAQLRGEDAAKTIQLYMVYAPEPPFDSGTPETAPSSILTEARASLAAVTQRREATARRIAGKLGIDKSDTPLTTDMGR
jgi:hypothetical protein